MDCLDYMARGGTPMYSARLGADGPPVVFLANVAGNTLPDWLDSAGDYLQQVGVPPARIAECKARALELVGILSSEQNGSPPGP